MSRYVGSAAMPSTGTEVQPLAALQVRAGLGDHLPLGGQAEARGGGHPAVGLGQVGGLIAGFVYVKFFHRGRFASRRAAPPSSARI